MQWYHEFIIGCISQSSTCFKSCFDINSRYTKRDLKKKDRTSTFLVLWVTFQTIQYFNGCRYKWRWNARPGESCFFLKTLCMKCTGIPVSSDRYFPDVKIQVRENRYYSISHAVTFSQNFLIEIVISECLKQEIHLLIFGVLCLAIWAILVYYFCGCNIFW